MNLIYRPDFDGKANVFIRGAKHKPIQQTPNLGVDWMGSIFKFMKGPDEFQE